MTRFFKTREYKNYKLCLAAVRALPTYNNLSKYWRYMNELINLAKTRYDNIGLNEKKEYVWIEELEIPDDLYQKYKDDSQIGGLRR